MTTILQISDTHIVAEGALVSGRLETAHLLAKLVARITSIRGQIGPIDAVFVSDDLSDDGSTESYDRFKALRHLLTCRRWSFLAITTRESRCGQPLAICSQKQDHSIGSDRSVT